jgi:hypothetical protein
LSRGKSASTAASTSAADSRLMICRGRNTDRTVPCLSISRVFAVLSGLRVQHLGGRHELALGVGHDDEVGIILLGLPRLFLSVERGHDDPRLPLGKFLVMRFELT